MAARVAAKLGYTNIKVFQAGIPAWAGNGNFLLTTTEFVDKRMGFIVLVDTRGPQEAEPGYIQGAVAIRLEDIVREKNQFPVDRKAYIVLYSQDTNLSTCLLYLSKNRQPESLEFELADLYNRHDVPEHN